MLRRSIVKETAVHRGKLAQPAPMKPDQRLHRGRRRFVRRRNCQRQKQQQRNNQTTVE